MRSIKKILCVISILIITTQCTAGNAITLKETTFNNFKAWKDDDHKGALKVFLKSCKKMYKKKKLHEIKKYGKLIKWNAVCDKAAQADKKNLNSKVFFETYFTPFNVIHKNSQQGLFTGYIESTLKGSFEKKGPYQYPIYSYPKQLTKKSIPERSHIAQGSLKGQGLEILYVNSKIDAFFLHIQGSGRVLMDDGNVVKLGFSGKNAYPYTSIGKVLIEKGALDKETISAQKIKAWLKTHAEQATQIMNKNKSYVFFKQSKSRNPIGAQGVQLTPQRSLAIDKKYLPYGVPLWLETTLPNNRNFNRLMITQDTGSAIKGPIRGDIFFGNGKEAEQLAGVMKQEGKYSILLPK